LKAEYKALTGTDFPVAGRTPAKPKEAPQKAANQKVAPKEKKPVVVIRPSLVNSVVYLYLILG
jgi:hypothetical protein